MDELVAWLRAQLDEDERVIQEAAEDYFYAEGHGRAVYRWFDRWAPDQPDPMLAEVEAKRALLDWAVAWLERDCAPWNADAIRLLAQPYAGRDGWREEWRA